jgi:hypothetical protein
MSVLRMISSQSSMARLMMVGAAECCVALGLPADRLAARCGGGHQYAGLRGDLEGHGRRRAARLRQEVNLGARVGALPGRRPDVG